jgi:hypothetical protein
MQDVLTKRSIVVQLEANPYGTELPAATVTLVEKTTGTPVVSKAVTVSATDMTLVELNPVITSGVYSLQVSFDNEFYDQAGTRELIIANVEVDQDADDSADTMTYPDPWTTGTVNGTAITNTSGGFKPVVLSYASTFAFDIDIIKCEKPTIDPDTQLVTDLTLTSSPITKDDIRVVVDGAEYNDYSIDRDKIVVNYASEHKSTVPAISQTTGEPVEITVVSVDRYVILLDPTGK